MISGAVDVGTWGEASEGVSTAAMVQGHLNMIWVLLAAGLVFFMQAGFMCLESGLTEAKNSINVAVKNLADFVIATLMFWFVGFGLMFGDTLWGLVGTSHLMVNADDPWRAVFFVFQAVFAGTAATITSGAVAGRIKFGGYLGISLVISALVYPVFGHWAWGGLLRGTASGWLETLGFIDFAGSTVVHSVGGWVALAGVMVVGPRLNRFDEKGNPRNFSSHSIVMAYLGTFILFFGWFGFNCGSTLAATSDVAGIALNTLLSACWGAFASGVVSRLADPLKKWRAEMVCNGLLGGLVGITAGCASVSPLGASCIGVVSGVLVYGASEWLLRRARLDDVVGAVAVHGVCGAWGTLAAGLFISPALLGETSRLWQVAVQGLGVVVCFGWSFFISYAAFSLMHAIWGLRVSAEDERLGLNVCEHGATSTLYNLTEAMNHVTVTKDYSSDLKVAVKDGEELAELALGFNNLLDATRTAMDRVREQSHLAREAEAEARRALGHVEVEKKMAQKASRQAQREHGRSVAAMAELAREQEKAVEKQAVLEQVLQTAVQLSEGAMQGIGRMMAAGNRVSVGIEDLNQASREIIQVVEVITSIADETNLLSLNATIEAARLHGSGQGFQVIAREIKALSHSTRDEVRNVAQRVGWFRKQVDHLAGCIGAQDSIADDHVKEITRFHEAFEGLLAQAGLEGKEDVAWAEAS
ncbi:ammonium transporter [Desulfoluna limicola]|uniref:Ammonium transporter n=2 Tax=Desulfoluna limicola TaxID=2810562 RepID=A0ABM7PJR9_9BACT|nr:ammonium transporter [Desulfoluna limicola]